MSTQYTVIQSNKVWTSSGVTDSGGNFSSSSVKNDFLIDGKTVVSANTRNYVAYFTSISEWNNDVITITFSEEITNVKFYGKTTQSSTATTYNLSNLFDYTLSNDNKTITFTNTYPNLLSSFYLLVYINPPLKTYTYTETLTNITSNASSSYTEGTTNTIIFTVPENYEIDTITSNIGTVTIAEDLTTATLVFTATEDITVTGTAHEKAIVKYTITENLTNITTDNIQTEIDENESFTFNYSVEKNYKIQSLVCNIGTVTISDDRTTATITGTATENIVVTGVGYIPTYYSYTETLTKITSNANEEYEKDTTNIIDFTVTSGYRISNLTTNIGTVTISEDEKTATLEFIATENIIVVGETTRTQTVTITGTIENATCNYNDGDYLIDDKIVTITANAGYEFLSSYTYRSGTLTYNATKSDDNTVITFSESSSNSVILNDEYNATKHVERLGTFTNLYKVVNSELTALSKVRFGNDNIDYGQYIASLFIIPFDITSIIGDRSNIILGIFDSNVESSLLTNYTIEIDGGTIIIPEKYSNVYDYINTTCVLRLPYFNKIILDTECVINQTLTIKFIIDMYSGSCTVNIYSTFTNGIIESQTVNISTQIPFIQKSTNSVVNTLSNINKSLIDTPTLEITRNIPYYAEGNIFGKETIVYDKINAVTGYCEVSEIKLNTNATNEERKTIIDLLKEGVFINENN